MSGLGYYEAFERGRERGGGDKAEWRDVCDRQYILYEKDVVERCVLRFFGVLSTLQ